MVVGCLGNLRACARRVVGKLLVLLDDRQASRARSTTATSRWMECSARPGTDDILSSAANNVGCPTGGPRNAAGSMPQDGNNPPEVKQMPGQATYRNTLTATEPYAQPPSLLRHLHLIVQDCQHHFVQAADSEKQRDVLVPKHKLEAVERAIHRPGNPGEAGCGEEGMAKAEFVFSLGMKRSKQEVNK